MTLISSSKTRKSALRILKNRGADFFRMRSFLFSVFKYYPVGKACRIALSRALCYFSSLHFRPDRIDNRLQADLGHFLFRGNLYLPVRLAEDRRHAAAQGLVVVDFLVNV